MTFKGTTRIGSVNTKKEELLLNSLDEGGSGSGSGSVITVHLLLSHGWTLIELKAATDSQGAQPEPFMPEPTGSAGLLTSTAAV